MLRFYMLIIFSIPLILYYVVMAEYICKHENKYDEDERYSFANRIIRSVQRRGRISTVSIGEDTLPEDGGYIMYANHQGKYDALGIIASHKKPCSVVMDAERSKMLLADQVVKLLRGKRLARNDMKQQVKELQSLIAEAKQGKKFIYFPEGKYEHNGNKLQEFRPGAFNCAKSAKVPIVPVAIYDSHIPFDFNSYRKVTTQVCFLDPIYYDEYSSMTTKEISEVVKNRIEEKMSFLEENRARHGYNSKFKMYSNS